jgi:hypothetical protein
VADGLPAGTKVEVRTSFDRSWARGFEVVEAVGSAAYVVRRLTDDFILPVAVPADDVRRERSRSYWWV